MIPILVRLAFAGIRTRLLASTLTIFLTGAASATIVLSLEVGATTSDPWMRTFDAAHGAHALANLSTEADAHAFAGLPGVSERDDPIPIVKATMVVDGREVDVFLAGLDGRPLINVPLSTEGAEVGGSGIVLERTLAQALDIPLGAEIEFPTGTGSVDLTAVGTAISPSQPRYPRQNPGLAWVTTTTLDQIEPDQSRWRWLQAVRLTDPSSAPLFAGNAAAMFPPNSASIETWQYQRENALMETQPMRLILTAYSLLLIIVSVAVVAILIGARASGQHREFGLLRAIGLTPRQVGMVYVIEAAALGIAGIVIGFAPGALLAPRLAATATASLVGSPTVEANPWHILVAGCVILPLIVWTSYVAARRATRSTVIQGIRAGAPAPQARPARIVAAIGLPIPIALGLRDLLARRTRAIWLTLAIAVTGAAMVATLSMQAVLSARPEGEPSDVPRELPVLIFTLDAVLALITFSALMSVALLSVRERIRDFGVLRTVGLTPRQVTTSLAGAHAALALIAALVSIPAGLGLFLALQRAASGGESIGGFAPWLWLCAVPFTMSLATALATGIPAKLAARIPVADAVRYE